MTASVGAVATQATAADAATVTSAQGSAEQAKAKSTAKLSKVAKQRIKARTAVSTAKKQVGDPYRWGATGPGAFDCSGLVLYAWRKAGVRLPRIAASQFRSVRKKVSWKNLKPGDLMFFRGLGHVGMYVGHGKMIHSPHSGARVRIDRLSGYRRAGFVGAVRPGV
ncbi:C40 family peptidase [Sphaerisporangium corydalis]|uniref:C40 family peptidase n=1 Tax=Sphaerisporangium corydalis TaxID=1441875 RepID=A0ABV9ERM4_9ACTN|nr:C40 family peptidase [Sphaerisporangium corydalis]